MPNKIIYLTTCNRVIRDQYSTLNSFVDVFSIIWIPKDMPFVINSFWVVGKIFTEGGAMTGEARIEFPDKTVSDPIVVTGDLKSGDADFACLFPFMKFSQMGRYYLRLKIGNEEIHTGNLYYFDVSKKP